MRSSLISFTSKAFEITKGEDGATNPGIHGKSLATWLEKSLRDRGVPTGEPIAEDFGWCIPIATRPHRTYVACASEDGSTVQWHAFVFAEGGLLSRLLGKDARATDVMRIFALTKELLELHPGVEDLQVNACRRR